MSRRTNDWRSLKRQLFLFIILLILGLFTIKAQTTVWSEIQHLTIDNDATLALLNNSTFNNGKTIPGMGATNYLFAKDLTPFSRTDDNRDIETVPIELLDFEAILVNDQVELFWTTATETSDDYFTIERSQTETFEKMVRVKTTNKNSAEQNFAATDKKPLNGISYYRLKQTDVEGNFNYSETISIEVRPPTSSAIIYHNPTEREIVIKLDNSNSPTDLVIYDQNGNISLVKSLGKVSGLTKVDLKDDLAPGVYYLQLNSGGNMTVQQLVLSK